MSERGLIERSEDLERRILDYHGTTLEEVLEIIAYLRDPGDSVIAGGSLAFGLGNGLSDLDVVVAGKQTIDSSRVPLEHFVKSLRVDVWKFDQGLIDDVFDRAGQALEDERPLHGAFGDVDHETDLKLLHRMAFGVLLEGPELELSSTSDPRDIARDLVVREYAERMRESLLLATLAVSVERWVTAALNARLAVECALNAVLTARGRAFTGDKWLLERLRGADRDLWPLYEPFAVLPDPGPACAEMVAQAGALCERLMGVTPDDALRTAAWANTDLQAAQAGGKQMLLSVRSGGLWTLDGTEHAAWQRLVERFDGPGEAAWWLCADCDGAEAKLCFALYEHGLLTLRWTRGLPVAELNLDLEASA